MRVIGRPILESFWQKHARARTPLTNWLNVVSKAEWNCFADIRRTFGTADSYHGEYGTYVIFNVGGSKYRVVTAIRYGVCVVIEVALTHAEYNTDKWKRGL